MSLLIMMPVSKPPVIVTGHAGATMTTRIRATPALRGNRLEIDVVITNERGKGTEVSMGTSAADVAATCFQTCMFAVSSSKKLFPFVVFFFELVEL
jgi:hypothetical protein